MDSARLSNSSFQPLSLLTYSESSKLTFRPFPHLQVDHALPKATYAKLAATFPPLESFHPDAASLDNRVLRIPAKQVIAEPGFSAEWKSFMAHHTSRCFWLEFLSIFGNDIKRKYPALEKQAGKPLEQWRVVRRGEGSGDVALDALLVVNTPVKGRASRVKGPHVDHRNKLWTGLFYMREENDTTSGGNLELFSASPDLRYDHHAVSRKQVVQEAEINYIPNRFVGFINGPEALHAVSPRPKTHAIRRYVDFVIELPRPVFELPQMGLFKRFWFRSIMREKTR
ncbi:hypothetical protein [Pseudomonas sp.]|uniref:hypothetical protein n=1 Tax=Pseudomonas sp. TaxID=306 RepID=UPI00289F8FAE|nr:hypothetical protein [Pseudomonas sp.]